jgi:hypothetical protein
MLGLSSLSSIDGLGIQPYITQNDFSAHQWFGKTDLNAFDQSFVNLLSIPKRNAKSKINVTLGPACSETKKRYFIKFIRLDT